MGRFAKAVAPSVLGLVGALGNWASSGTFDRVSITAAVLGVITSAVVYFVPNAKR